jgi:TolB protein
MLVPRSGAGLVAAVATLTTLVGCRDRRPAPTEPAPSVSPGSRADAAPVVDPAALALRARLHGRIVIAVAGEAAGAGDDHGHGDGGPDLLVVHLGPAPGRGPIERVHGDGVGLYPTDQRDGAGALLAIATWGPDQGHLEQLVVVGSGASAGADPAAPAVLRRVGPVAEKLRHPQVGPDGHTVVFESSARSFRDLYRLDLTGPHDATPVRLTDSPHGNFEPALAPDGSSLVFVSSRDGDSEVYARARPLAGGQAGTERRLTAFHRDDWGPRWSPDGKTLAFVSDREGTPRVFLMAPDGTGQRRLTRETEPEVIEESPRWSPDGAWIALTVQRGGAVEVHVVASGGEPAPGPGLVTRVDLTPDGATDEAFAWSPDSAELVLAREGRGLVVVPRGGGPGVTLRAGAIEAGPFWLAGP